MRSLDILIFVQMARDIATALYYTGIDPFTKKEVYVPKWLRDRKMQRALMQFFKPENSFLVREALLKAGRQDLIGNGCDCLLRPAQGKRRRAVGNALRGVPAPDGTPRRAFPTVAFPGRDAVGCVIPPGFHPRVQLRRSDAT
jgi:hypothetical protein